MGPRQPKASASRRHFASRGACASVYRTKAELTSCKCRRAASRRAGHPPTGGRMVPGGPAVCLGGGADQVFVGAVAEVHQAEVHALAVGASIGRLVEVLEPMAAHDER